RRHHRDRRAGPRRGARVGGEVSGRALGHDRDPAVGGARRRRPLGRGHVTHARAETAPDRPGAGAGAVSGDPARRATDEAVERVARASYGRLLAILAASTGDLELAEDCLSDAFERALRTWPESGVPDSPERWLVTVARNRGRDVLRSAAHRTGVPLDSVPAEAMAVLDGIDPDALPERRLA